jgi:hypothetical protein
MEEEVKSGTWMQVEKGVCVVSLMVGDEWEGTR